VIKGVQEHRRMLRDTEMRTCLDQRANQIQSKFYLTLKVFCGVGALLVFAVQFFGCTTVSLYGGTFESVDDCAEVEQWELDDDLMTLKVYVGGQGAIDVAARKAEEEAAAFIKANPQLGYKNFQAISGYNHRGLWSHWRFTFKFLR
jgi:hypothetical protein